MVEDHENGSNVLHLCRQKDVDTTEVMDTFSTFHSRRIFNENPLAF